MTNKKSTKRALLSSALALIVCIAMLVGTTFAWFTDNVTSGGNKIVAGNLDVDLYMWNGAESSVEITDESDPIFGDGAIAQNDVSATLWEPGKTQVVYLSIKNNGSLDLKYKVAIDVENPADGKNLYEVMQYAITPDAKFGEVEKWEKGTSVVPGINASGSNDVELKNGEEHFFALSVHMNESAGNEYQGGKVNFDIKVLATQLASEFDSFDNQYDKLADYDGEIKSAAALEAALNAGGTYKLVGDITLADGEKLTIAADTAVVLDMNGKDIVGNSAKADGAPIVNNGTLVINGGDAVISNATANGAAVIENNGTLTLNGGTYEGAPLTDGGYSEYSIVNHGVLTIEDGTNISADRGTLRLYEGSVTTINGGTFTNNDIGSRSLTNHVVYIEEYSNAKLTINDGTFKHLYAKTSGGVVINNSGTETVYVNGGNFSGGNYWNESNLSTYGYPKASFVVTGGTYTAINTKFLAEGYIAVDNGDGTYTVADVSDKTKVADGYYTDEDKNHYVYNANGLIAMREVFGTWAADTLAGKSINIMSDIDATGKTWTTAVIASGSSSRNGFTFNGNGHTISNLTIVKNDNNATPGTGLFAMNSGNDTPTTFKDITFDNVTVNGGIHTGVLWGQMYGKLVVDNVSVIGSNVTGTSNVGALVARNGDDSASEITFRNCTVKNTKVTSTGGGDNAGASAFLGMALKVAVNGVSVNLTFEGANISEGNTLTTADGQCGGGIYTTSNWGEPSWDAPVVVKTFTNYNSN